ncbi:MAG: response regulator [Bacilli bacterium]|nr:response regulator [Bacilli bacterium]
MSNDYSKRGLRLQGLAHKNLSEIERFSEYVPGGFFAYHAGGNEELIYANQTVCRIFGCETLEEFKELTGYTFKGMVHPDDYEQISKSIDAQLDHGDEGLDHIEFRITRKDGEISYITDFGRLVETEDWGKVFFVFIEDITFVRKSIENKMLKDALAYAEKASKAKSEFVSNMSHDLRTPLHTIAGTTELALAHLDDPEKVEKSLKQIKTSSKALLALTSDLLDIAKIENGEFVFNLRPYDIREAFQTLVDIIAGRIADKKQTFNTWIDVIQNPFVMADSVRTCQIVLNILTNANKFTPEGGQIEFSLREEPSKVDQFHARHVFVIKDNGIGMDPEFVAKACDAFEREDAQRITKDLGSGLGLFIANNILTALGGKLEIESEKGKGTTVKVAFEFSICGEEEVENPLQGINGYHILIAEDQMINREIIKETLEDLGATVDAAQDGKEAFDLFLESEPHSYDIILMDLRMPVMDGFESTRAIRSLDRIDAKNVPIVSLTADAYYDDRVKCLEAGMDEHLPKPVEIELLTSTIKTLVKKRQKKY